MQITGFGTTFTFHFIHISLRVLIEHKMEMQITGLGTTFTFYFTHIFKVSTIWGAQDRFLYLMHKGRMVGIPTIQWVEYQLAAGFLTSGWKSNLDGLISNHVLGNPTIDLSWP